MVRSCKKGADKVLREQRDAGDDLHQQGWGHSVPRGHLTGFTAVIDCPEWRREGLLHRMAIVRDRENAEDGTVMSGSAEQARGTRPVMVLCVLGMKRPRRLQTRSLPR